MKLFCGMSTSPVMVRRSRLNICPPCSNSLLGHWLWICGPMGDEYWGHVTGYRALIGPSLVTWLLSSPASTSAPSRMMLRWFESPLRPSTSQLAGRDTRLLT